MVKLKLESSTCAISQPPTTPASDIYFSDFAMSANHRVVTERRSFSKATRRPTLHILHLCNSRNSQAKPTIFDSRFQDDSLCTSLGYQFSSPSKRRVTPLTWRTSQKSRPKVQTTNYPLKNRMTSMIIQKGEHEHGELRSAALVSCSAHSALPILSGMTVYASSSSLPATLLMTRQCLPGILSIPPTAQLNSFCHCMDWVFAGFLPARGQLLRRSVV